MAQVHKDTVVALPYVSKIGFCGAFVKSLADALVSGGMTGAAIHYLKDFPLVHGRNQACKAALEAGAEYLFFIDSDMDFPPDVLPRLKACNADIACTDMWSRNIPSFRTVGRSKKRENGMCDIVSIPEEEAVGVTDIDMCGMACTLIKTSLLRRMAERFKDQPWFWTAMHGEDATFCFNAREVGATLKCDFGMVAGHWGMSRLSGQPWSRDPKNQDGQVSEPEMLKRMGVQFDG